LTLAKAYKLVKYAIKQKEETKQGLLDPKKPWNQGSEMSKELASGLADFLENDIVWLNVLIKQLPPLPKCNHPKELRDKYEGKIYCMGCNENLE